MAKIRSNPSTDSYTAVHWLAPAEPVWRCLGILANGPCDSRSDDAVDALRLPTEAIPDYYCVNGCLAGIEQVGPLKVIIEVGIDRSLLNVVLPDGVSVTVWGNGDMGIFTDPDDELGENPDVRVESGRVIFPGGYDESPAKQAQHQ